MVKQRWFRWLLSLILLSALILPFFPRRISPKMVDFEVNYRAGQRLLRGETLYRLEDGHYQFKYPPFAAFLYLPLSFLPLTAAKLIWLYVIILAIAAILLLSSRLATGEKIIPFWLPLLTGLILARFFLREMSLGQINAVVTTILLFMIWLWQKQMIPNWYQLKPGVLWGLACALKPYALIFLPLFLLRRTWRLLASGLASMFLAFFAPALYYGFKGNWQVHQEWISHLRRSTPPLLTSQDNVSVFGLLAKWGGAGFPAWRVGILLVGVFAITMFFLVLRSSGVSRPVILESSSLLLLIPLVSPLGWDYTFLSSSAAISLLLARFCSFPKAGRIFLAVIFGTNGLIIYDLLGRQLYVALMRASLPTILSSLVFIYLCWLRFRKYA